MKGRASERERSREVTKRKREKVLQELRVQNNQCWEVLVILEKMCLFYKQSVTMVNNKATARLQVQTKTNEILWATDMTLFCHIGMRFRPSIIASRPTAIGHQSHSLGCYTNIRESSICLGYPCLLLFFVRSWGVNIAVFSDRRPELTRQKINTKIDSNTKPSEIYTVQNMLQGCCCDVS
jgi:hypothetical protein